MKKESLLFWAGFLMVLLWVIPAGAWQGRTAGYGETTGLMADESDFLIHPSYMASGNGVNLYGFYRLTYDKANSWDYHLWVNGTSFSVINTFTTNGCAWSHQLQAGAAFPLGAGRMGVFLEGQDTRGKYNDGFAPYAGTGGWGNGYNTFEMENTLDNAKLRLLYGLPVNSVNVGAELQVAYVKESQDTKIIENGGYTDENYPWGAENMPAWNLYPYGIPYDSKYWQAQAKVSVNGKAGNARYAATVKAGLPFASDNHYVYGFNGAPYADMGGEVSGINVGGDVWLRVPVSEKVVLPFVVGANYRTLKRDGSGQYYNLGFLPAIVNYDHTTTNLNIQAGGGVDMTPAKGTKVGAGVYYHYISYKQESFNDWARRVNNGSEWVGGNALSDWYYYRDFYTDMPQYTEHRATFKAAAEKELSPMVALRGGLGAFYGFVQSDYAYSAYYSYGSFYPLNVSTDGSNMGVNASVGASVKLASVVLEPFVSAGYTKYQTSGNGTFGSLPAEMEFTRTDWQISGGLAVRR